MRVFVKLGCLLGFTEPVSAGVGKNEAIGRYLTLATESLSMILSGKWLIIHLVSLAWKSYFKGT